MSIYRRTFLIVLSIIICMTISKEKVSACDVDKCDEYICQMVFGSKSYKYKFDDKTKILLNAIYICSCQEDNKGILQLNYLKGKGIGGTKSLDDINISSSLLNECSHKYWSYEMPNKNDIQSNRKTVLENAVYKVFNFGLFENLFGCEQGESFTELLYYLHILGDYIVDSANSSTIKYNKSNNSLYTGKSVVQINNNKPVFYEYEKNNINTVVEYAGVDELGRAGAVKACIGYDNIAPSNSRDSQSQIIPPGYTYVCYPSVIKGQGNLYNRCHLLSHKLGGKEDKKNFITGTAYLNNPLMKEKEDMIIKYIETTNNHVLYRVTPVYEGLNLIASGVKMEAYSIEDSGEGICFNVFCFNVQPGINIDYKNGSNSLCMLASCKDDSIIPFAIYNSNDNNPDLIFEINRVMEILFLDQNKSRVFLDFKNMINSIANDARSLSYSIKNSEYLKTEMISEYYYKYNECLKKFYEIMKSYLPQLLYKEKFFKKIFK